MKRNRNARLGASLALALTAAVAVEAQADVPAYIPVQGYLSDAGTAPVSADGGLDFTFRLYSAATGGTLLHEESQTVPVVDGFFHVYLGDGSPLDLGIFVLHQDIYLGISVDGETEMIPRTQMGSVAYAAYAGRAAAVDWTSITNRPPGLDEGGLAYTGVFPITVGAVSRAISLSQSGCTEGATWVSRGGGWSCELPSTPLSAGRGITIAGGAISANMTHINADLNGQFIRPLTGSCPTGIASISSGGNVTCVTASGGITAVNAGTGTANPGGGVTASTAGSTVTVGYNATVIQQRVTGACGASQAITGINQNGSVSCGTPIPSQVLVGGVAYNPQAQILADCGTGYIRAINPQGGVSCSTPGPPNLLNCGGGQFVRVLRPNGSVDCATPFNEMNRQCAMFVGQCDRTRLDPFTQAECQWTFTAAAGGLANWGGSNIRPNTSRQTLTNAAINGFPQRQMARIHMYGGVDDNDIFWFQYLCPDPGNVGTIGP